METSPKNAPWTPKRVVHELMAIWFGSVHAVSTVCRPYLCTYSLDSDFSRRSLLLFTTYAFIQNTSHLSGESVTNSTRTSSAPAWVFLFSTPSSRSLHASLPSSHVSRFHTHLVLSVVDVDSVSTRRSALKPFTLADGSGHANVGDWFCTPVRAIMTNPAHYPEALQFSGFRFADPNVVKSLSGNTTDKLDRVMQEKPSKLTDVDMTYHVWGTGRMAW
jgi:hypothetical protein